MTLVSLAAIVVALALLMASVYRGHSVIVVAPVAALLAVAVTSPTAVAPVFTGIFMDRASAFVKNTFPIFLAGAVFGRLVQVSGFARGLVAQLSRVLGANRAIATVVLSCSLLSYFGPSPVVVVFTVYPFAAELFRTADIPKRLIPGAIALGSLTFTMDALPGSAQIQNLVAASYFHTTAYAAPALGLIGSAVIAALGIGYLESRRRLAAREGEGYGTGHRNEPPAEAAAAPGSAWKGVVCLAVVALANIALTRVIPRLLGARSTLATASVGPGTSVTVATADYLSTWAMLGALIAGSVAVAALAPRTVLTSFAASSRDAVAGALLACMNTASEFGFGAVIASLPGFGLVATQLQRISNPLVNEAVSTNVLSGITGSASAGLSIALGSLGPRFVAGAQATGVPLSVLHRVAAMAAGGMDTLPHNGAVVTILAVCGLSHRESYRDIFACTLIKTAAVFLVIGLYYASGGHLV